MIGHPNARRLYRTLLFLYPSEFPEHLHILAGDMRQGARALAKSPAFVIAALLAIVLGVTAATVVFSLIQAVLLRPLPYANPDRLVYMWTPSPSTAGRELERPPLYSDLAAWRHTNRSFEEITAMQRYIAILNDGTPERIGAARVLGNFFLTMGARAYLGRTIQAHDQKISKLTVAVLSYRIWQSRFGADPGILGKTVHIDHAPYRVIGVMAPEFSYPHGNDFPGQYQFASLPRTDVWVPVGLTPKQLADDFDGFDAAIGRLHAGVTLPHAQAEMAALQKRLDLLHAEENRDLESVLVPFVETAVGPVRPLLNLLGGVVCLVLLMVCSNFAGLLIARAADRVHELGVRRAVGAQRSRLVRLMLTESVMLSVAGGALAIPLSYGILTVMAQLNPGDIPGFEETVLDARVLLFGILLSLATGFLSGIFPALSASIVNVGDLLRQGGRGITGVSWRARNVLIVSEIALAVVLLSGAGLLIRSYLLVLGQDKGFSRSTLTLSILLDPSPKNADVLRRELMDRIRAIPDVTVAGSIDDLPLSTFEDKALIDVEGYSSKLKQLASVRETGGEYFRAMGISLVAGRYLNDHDIPARTDAPHNVVVSASFAKRYFTDRVVVGRHLKVNGGGWRPDWSTIVGVIGDVRHSSLEDPPQPTIYFQSGLADSVALRTRNDPGSAVAQIRKVVADFHAGFSVTDVQTMDGYVQRAAAHRRFQTVALAFFSAAALVLALVGLYGLLSYAVKQRTAEIGVRMAVGASRRAIIGMVAFYGLKLALTGIAVGIVLAFGSARLMASFVYGIRAVDPLTFSVVPVFVLLVVVIACIVPAWRAARIHPITALRHP